MRILFSTFGSLGDVHPYLALALEAKRRGHQPILATGARYKSKIEALEIEFRAVRPDLPIESEFGEVARRVMDLKNGPQVLFRDIIAPAARDSLADLLDAGADCDLMVTHPAAPCGPLAAQKLEKPWISSVLAPISLWSKYDPPVPPTFPALAWMRALGPLWAQAFFAVGKAVTRGWVRAIDDLRGEIGLAPGAHPMFEGQFSPRGTIALFSRHFAAPQRDWPANTTATGFCFYDAKGYESQSETQWRAWVEAGPKPVVFTLGSSAVYNAGDFWNWSRRYVESNAETGERGVFLTGGEVLQDPSAWELEVPYAPYSDLFPRARFVVHQGGVGTTSQALRAGIPQMIMPYAFDQPDHAARIARLGVGLGVKRAEYVSGKCEEDFVPFWGDDFQTRAQSLGAKIRLENGPKVACEVLERLGESF